MDCPVWDCAGLGFSLFLVHAVSMFSPITILLRPTTCSAVGLEPALYAAYNSGRDVGDSHARPTPTQTHITVATRSTIIVRRHFAIPASSSATASPPCACAALVAPPRGRRSTRTGSAARRWCGDCARGLRTPVRMVVGWQAKM